MPPLFRFRHAAAAARHYADASAVTMLRAALRCAIHTLMLSLDTHDAMLRMPLL